jgi:spore coat protein A
MTSARGADASRGERRFPRRTLMAAAGAGALSLALPVRFRPQGGMGLFGAESLASAPRPFHRRLPIPKVLSDADLIIPIKEAHVPILPGRETKMWTYDGTFPGPTIRRHAGQGTRVTFVHKLPVSAGELSVHLHGGHTPSDDDGQPGGATAKQKLYYCDVSPNLSPKVSGNDLLISPGEHRLYTYPLMEDGEDERSAFQWYHDHRLEATAPNVWRGLAGMMILDDDFEEANGIELPTGQHDIPLMVADRSFNRHNQLTNPFGANPPDDGVTGKYVLVNGAYAPFHEVAARRYRLRILNGSNFRVYNLYLSNGRAFKQIATEAGLMPKTVSRNRILIGPAERVEVVVDFTRDHGSNVVLRSAGDYPGKPHLGPPSFDGPIMQFRVGRQQSDSSHVPMRLRPLPAWALAAKSRWVAGPSPDHSWEVTLGGLPTRWLINGRSFDPSYVDHQVTIDTTEIWRLSNPTSVGHMMHIHSNDWYMLERKYKGVVSEPRPYEECLKETFFLRPKESVVVAGHFSDHLGKFVVHCHMLDHEDHGLMSQFEVVA